MASVPPPPAPSYSITRFRRSSASGLTLSAVAVGMIAGALLGISATLAAVAPPPSAERCSGSADYIGCIIELAGVD